MKLLFIFIIYNQAKKKIYQRSTQTIQLKMMKIIRSHLLQSQRNLQRNEQKEKEVLRKNLKKRNMLSILSLKSY